MILSGRGKRIDIDHPPQSQIDHQGIQIMRNKSEKKREYTGGITTMV
jgi:hypothetical protein